MVLNTGLKYSSENLIYPCEIDFTDVITAKAMALAVMSLLTGDLVTSAVILLAYSLLDTKSEESRLFPNGPDSKGKRRLNPTTGLLLHLSANQPV